MKFQVCYSDARGKAHSLIFAKPILLHKLLIFRDSTCEYVFREVMKALSGLAAEMTVMTIPTDRAKFPNMGLPCCSKH